MLMTVIKILKVVLYFFGLCDLKNPSEIIIIMMIVIILIIYSLSTTQYMTVSWLVLSFLVVKGSSSNLARSCRNGCLMAEAEGGKQLDMIISCTCVSTGQGKYEHLGRFGHFHCLLSQVQHNHLDFVAVSSSVLHDRRRPSLQCSYIPLLLL